MIPNIPLIRYYRCAGTPQHNVETVEYVFHITVHGSGERLILNTYGPRGAVTMARRSLEGYDE